MRCGEWEEEAVLRNSGIKSDLEVSSTTIFEDKQAPPILSRESSYIRLSLTIKLG